MELDRDICLGSIPTKKPSEVWWWNPIGSKSTEYKEILEGLKIAASGSCAIVTYLQGNEVYVANTGDCRAVIGRSMVIST